MFKKSIGTLAIAAALFGNTCMPAFAATPEIIQQDIPTGYTEVQPRINWSGTAKLNTCLLYTSRLLLVSGTCRSIKARPPRCSPPLRR